MQKYFDIKNNISKTILIINPPNYNVFAYSKKMLRKSSQLSRQSINAISVFNHQDVVIQPKEEEEIAVKGGKSLWKKVLIILSVLLVTVALVTSSIVVASNSKLLAFKEQFSLSQKVWIKSEVDEWLQVNEIIYSSNINLEILQFKILAIKEISPSKWQNKSVNQTNPTPQLYLVIGKKQKIVIQLLSNSSYRLHLSSKSLYMLSTSKPFQEMQNLFINDFFHLEEESVDLMLRFLLNEVYSYAFQEKISFQARKMMDFVLDPTSGAYEPEIPLDPFNNSNENSFQQSIVEFSKKVAETYFEVISLLKPPNFTQIMSLLQEEKNRPPQIIADFHNQIQSIKEQCIPIDIYELSCLHAITSSSKYYSSS